MPSTVFAGRARSAAVAVLANMMVTALGGADERRTQDRGGSSVTGGGDLPTPVLDGPGPRAHRVHDAPVRPGRGSDQTGLGPLGRGRDRHRPGSLRTVGSDPRRVRRAGAADLPRRGWGDLRARTH